MGGVCSYRNNYITCINHVFKSSCDNKLLFDFQYAFLQKRPCVVFDVVPLEVSVILFYD
eukprot:UN07825